jgi:hypothetical protein
MATEIQGINQVEELASKIKDARRTRPICLVSIGQAEDAPGFDLDYLEGDAAEVCDFYVIKTGDLTREFMNLIPENTQVYGGAARVYPVDFANSKSASPLRYPIPPVQLAKATANLLRDIWAYANQAGLILKPAANLNPERVTVQAIYGGDVAVMKRANGNLISVRSEALFPGISLDRVFTLGQELEGTFDPNNRAFALTTQNPTVAEVVEHFGLGSVTLGLVRETTRKTATVAIHPNLTFEVEKKEITGNERDVISDYLNVGQVYSFRFYRDPQGHFRLKCNDIDDDEPLVPALSLIPGSGPWLEEGIGVVAEDSTDELTELAVTAIDLPTEAEVDAAIEAAAKEAEAQETSVPVPGLTKAENRQLSQNAFFVNHMKGQVIAANEAAQRAKEEADAIAVERNSLAKENATLKAQLREQGAEFSQLKKDKRAAANRTERDPWETRAQFDTAAEWLREELRRQWLDTYTPSDRRQYNMDAVNWSFGERFFDEFTEANFDATKLRKIIRTIVELISNRNSVPGGTEAHPLTDNFKGQIRREAVGKQAGAMRMYVEEHTAGAMRLHYWKLDAGGYELDGVGHHDTFKMRSA